MKLSQEGNVLNVYENIKSIEDYEALKATIDSMINTYNSVTLNIVDSISITSSVIGYLNKIVNDGKRVYINVKENSLYELLDDLNLISVFNVRKM